MFARIREDIRSVFERDPAARSVWEVLTCYPGLHAVWAHRLSSWFWRRRLFWLGRFVSHLARWLTGIEIHPGARLGRRFFIDHGMGVVIGETAEVGDDCTLYQGVTLGGTSLAAEKRHPTLGNDVVVGSGAKVLGAFTVGDGARIGSNAVVVKAVPAGATAIGIPARIVHEQKPELSASAQNIASKLGFDAYGVTRDMPDPVANAISAMLDHIQQLDERLVQVCRALKQLDVQTPAEVGQPIDKLELPDFCGAGASQVDSPAAAKAPSKASSDV